MPQWLPFRRDLGLQLLALYLLFVGPVITAALLFDALAGARLQRDVKAADLALARSIALETQAFVENALGTEAELAALPAVQTLDTNQLRTPFAAVAAARREVNLVYVLDAAGIMLYHYPEGPGSTVGVDFAYRAYFQDARQAAAPLMSAGRISPTTDKPVTTAVMPVRNAAGAFQGVVATNLNLEQLSATLAAIASDPAPGLSVAIVDGAGQIIADSANRPLPSSGAAALGDDLSVVLSGAAGSLTSRDEDGAEWLRSHVPIASAGWAVVVQRPAALAFASPRAFHNGLLVAIGVFLVGGLFFWMMLSRRVIGPLERLAAFSAGISQRAVAPADRAHLAQLSARTDQMGHLIRALTRMEHDIERRFAELSTLLDTSTAVVSTLESKRVLDTILEQVQRLLAVDMGAIIGLDEAAGQLELRAARGLSPEYSRRIRTRSLPAEPNSASILAIRRRQPVNVADTDTEPGYPETLRERARVERYRAIMAVPLLAPHAPPSALVVYWREPHLCPPEEVNLLVSFANHAAMALENAALFGLTDEKLREQTRTLEALVQSLADGLILEGPSGESLYVNRRIAELAGLPPAGLAGQPASGLRARLLERAEGQVDLPGGAQEVTLQHRGRALALRVQSFDVTAEDGQLLGRGQLWVDVTGDREVDRMKSALIATVSHELRTPLAAIKGNITSLLADDVEWDAAAQREFLQAASAETDRLAALVTDLLDLSRIQAGTFSVHQEACPLGPLVARAAAQVRPAAGNRLTVDLPPTLPLVSADAPRVEAVLRNLLENAVKYSPAHGEIRVWARPENGHVVVRVGDEGPGIAPEHRERVFERFYRIEADRLRHAGGAGLGLAICKGFVEAHGGRIWVEPGGAGAVFGFTLPAAAEVHGAA
jgi:signal transduction histidine kinase